MQPCRLGRLPGVKPPQPMAFAELCITSNFTFLTGGSHPQEYARAGDRARPARLRHRRPQLGRRPRARPRRSCARPPATAPPSPRLLPAARLCLAEGPELTALPRDRAGWGRLCRLLTLGARRADKGNCLLHLDDLAGLGPTCTCCCTRRPAAACAPGCRAPGRIARRHPHAHLVASPRYDGQDAPAHRPAGAGSPRDLGLPLVASAEPIMHHGSRRRLVDVLTCIREGIRIDAIGRAALANAERRLRSEAEMLRLFEGHEAAVHRAGEIAADCRFSLDELRYEYPKEIWDGEDPQARLERLTAEGLRWRYPGGVPETVARPGRRTSCALIAPHELRALSS